LIRHFQFYTLAFSTIFSQTLLMPLIFRTRKVVKPADLNSRNTLFGGRLLEWIDEECGVYAACQMETQTLVTKSMTEINFLAPARQGDVNYVCEC